MYRSKRRRRSGWLIVGVLAGLLVTAAVGALAFYRPFASASRGISADTETASIPAPPPLPVKRTTFLVMGVDKRPDDTGRADSMMVVSFDSEQNRLAAVSLPRDTWTEIPGHGYDKINHSYAFGGEKLAIASAQNLLGIPIDHYVTVTFQDFAKIVDAVGGVDIDAEKSMHYVDPSDTGMGPDGLVIDIAAGPQHMDGLTALKYSRFRHDDEGDMGRIRRQQQVAKALLKAAARPAIVTKVPQLIPALSDALDTDMSVAEMIKYGLAARDALGSPLKTGVFGGREQMLGGIFYYIPDLVKDRAAAYELLVGSTPTEEFLARARADQERYARTLSEEGGAAVSAADGGHAAPDASGDQAAPAPAPTPTTPKPAPKPAPKPGPLTVAIIDATGKNIAQEYVRKFRDAGFRVARVSKANRTIERTAAIDHAGQPGTEARILAVLPGAMLLSVPDAGADEAVEIVLGTDLLNKPAH
jgi:LCP family protein required for cell wall assembly